MIDLKELMSDSREPSNRSHSQTAVRIVGEKEEEFSMFRKLRRKTVALLVHATLIVAHVAVAWGQDVDIKKQMEGVDLEGVKQLTLSHNGELAAGLTVVYRNHHAESLMKVWSIKAKQLVHEFRFRGKAHALAFSPDDATLVTADASGNLATETKIRFWDLTRGKELKQFAFVGQIRELIFSPDGGRLAAAVGFNYFDSIVSQAFKDA